MLVTLHMLRILIRESIHDVETYRTMTGKRVPFGSKMCVKDLEHRIEDACEVRDSLSRRSDAREHYNGMLKVLRREFRRANRT